MSDNDVRVETLPSSAYLDPDVLSRERERLFARTWQCAGHADDVAEPGQFVATELLHEPLLIARGDDGVLRAMSNVCLHRAGPVARGKGRRASFQCAYHGWTYRLDGALHRAPECDPKAVEGLELPRVAVASWGDLVFVRQQPGLVDVDPLHGIDPEIATGMSLVERREYRVEANWKVYVDNYLEGYHIPLIHPALHRLLDYDAYRVETHESYSQQIAPYRDAAGEDERALYYWVFPNLMLNFYPGSLQLNVVIPLDADSTLTVFEWYASGGELTDAMRESIEFSDKVQREDMAIVADVQRGLRSRSYEQGPLVLSRENGLAHFHELWKRAMAD